MPYFLAKEGMGAISVVLYLQYLGLPEPSGWEGDHPLLLTYLWRVATLRDGRNQQRPAAQRSASGAAVATVAGRLHISWRHHARRTQTLSRRTVILVPADCFASMPQMMINALSYNRRLSYFLRHNTEDTFFQYETKFFWIKTTHTPFFLKVWLHFLLRPVGYGPRLHNATKAPPLEMGCFAQHGRKVQIEYFLFATRHSGVRCCVDASTGGIDAWQKHLCAFKASEVEGLPEFVLWENI